MSELKGITINEDYQDLVPNPTKEERIAIKHSMMFEGQKDPIVINDKGIILDGHTRFEICEELNLTPKTRIQQFNNLDEEKRYVIECNTNRRQLNPFQKVELFYNIFKQFRDEAEENHINSNVAAFKNHPLGGSLRRYSSLIGVGEKRTHQALKIIENGTERLKASLRLGTVTINMAHKIMTSKSQLHKKRTKHAYPSMKMLLDFLKDDLSKKDKLNEFIEEWRNRYN